MFVESGVDWTWRNFAYKHETFANAAYSSVIYAGYVVPAATPVALYMAGIFRHDEKMQIAGLALGQSMILANAFHTILKLSTGRTEPYIINQYHHNRIDTSGDFSGEFDWFKMDIVDGWPSGHTLSAFATAATISEIYNDKTWVKIAAYSYAVLVGAGVSFNVHWASDVLAGALIGYAVGATVGRSFRQLLKPVEQHNGVSLSMTAYPLGISMRW
ncbi:hypothetical protein AGMMS49579_07240 [Spirochaetia bacterium]|nr:hypothetical protein AGMMS49579_07240 [Spirochaetia bacterium]